MACVIKLVCVVGKNAHLKGVFICSKAKPCTVFFVDINISHACSVAALLRIQILCEVILCGRCIHAESCTVRSVDVVLIGTHSVECELIVLLLQLEVYCEYRHICKSLYTWIFSLNTESAVKICGVCDLVFKGRNSRCKESECYIKAVGAFLCVVAKELCTFSCDLPLCILARAARACIVIGVRSEKAYLRCSCDVLNSVVDQRAYAALTLVELH